MNEVQINARAVRKRLWNPKNGISSSELEVLSSPLFRSKKALQRVADQKAEADFRLQASIGRAVHAARAADHLLGALRERARIVALASALQQEEFKTMPKLAEIVTAVCERYKVTKIDVFSHRRTLNLVIPRQVIMYLARHFTFRSLPEIGRVMGGRDHTTVICGCRRTTERLAAGDKQLAADIAAIKQRLNIA